MKNKIFFITLVVSSLVIQSCKTSEKATELIIYRDSLLIQASNQMVLYFNNGKSFNHPTFVIWEEDINGNYQRTIFITKSYASGIFEHQMLGDSVWVNKSGSSYQPAALPYWTYKKGPISGKELIPTPENPFIDGYTGATPVSNFQFQTGEKSNNDQYRILIEVNQAWDWNNYWTNNKYPYSTAYKHSAQPSLIYEGVINLDEASFVLKPIGHGDPKGESGKLFTDLSTLTTAKEIFDSIKVEVMQNKKPANE